MKKSMKKFASALLIACMAMSMATTAMAADATALTEGKSENTIPVTVSAEATVFNVDVPTSFPTEVAPDTGETTEADGVKITNNSYGSIVVTNITAKDNAQNNSGAATWHLAAFDKDMSKVGVDSNLIGLSVQPVKNGGTATAGTALKTTDADKATQELLSAANEEWVIEGKDAAATNGNVLKVAYDTNVSPVSTKITDLTAANLVITVAWNTNN